MLHLFLCIAILVYRTFQQYKYYDRFLFFIFSLSNFLTQKRVWFTFVLPQPIWGIVESPVILSYNRHVKRGNKARSCAFCGIFRDCAVNSMGATLVGRLPLPQLMERARQWFPTTIYPYSTSTRVDASHWRCCEALILIFPAYRHVFSAKQSIKRQLIFFPM